MKILDGFLFPLCIGKKPIVAISFFSMKRALHPRVLVTLTFLVLCTFFSTLVETSRVHFFHDVLPENDVQYFARLAARSHDGQVQRAVAFDAPEPCPFNRLLSFLEAASHGVTLSNVLKPESSGAARVTAFFTPAAVPNGVHRARAPPV